ncbi:hypothetical protein HWV62_375 [Athelia sp. TMB]|nr:hypothetical protein HWV62_375 [Athelia sp. TMB]
MRGRVLFRDYGRHDLTQLRFKAVPSGQKVTETTKVAEEVDIEVDANATASQITSVAIANSTYDVPSDELLVSSSELPQVLPSPSSIHPNLSAPLADCPPHPLFAIEQLGVDRRLIVNRKRQLKMYRVWMQGRFKKLA